MEFKNFGNKCNDLHLQNKEIGKFLIANLWALEGNAILDIGPPQFRGEKIKLCDECCSVH